MQADAGLGRNRGPGNDTLLLRLIPGYLYSAYSNRQFHTLPNFIITLDSNQNLIFFITCPRNLKQQNYEKSVYCMSADPHCSCLVTIESIDGLKFGSLP